MVTSQSDFYSMRRLEPTTNGEVVAVHRVIQTVSVARSIYFKLRSNHVRRIALYAEIGGMFAGNPPYDRDQLSAANLSHIANFNTLEPRANYKRAGQAYWNLLYTSESIINISLRYPDSEAPHYAEIISRNWNNVVREMWPSFDTNVAVLCGNLVQLGISPIIWSNEKDFRWRVVELSKFFVPDQSASDLDLLSVCCIENEISIVELMEVYQEFKDNRDATEWDIDELEKFLIYIANAPQKDTVLPYDYDELRRKLSAGDISYDRFYNETVRLVSLFYKENDGSISHFMFHRTWDGGPHKFLYLCESQYKSFDSFLVLFTQSPGEQFIHANRGMGHEIFALAQAKMMLDNSLLDMGRWASTPILKSPTNTVKEAAQLRFYPGVPTDIGGAEFVENTVGANLQAVIATSQYIESIMQRNIAFSGDNPSEPDAAQGSLAPTQARLQAFKEFAVLKVNVNHFYRTFDVVLREMTIKIMHSKEGDSGYDIKNEWIQRCVDEGVPAELFKGARENQLPPRWAAKATRSCGAGSQVGHIISLQELMPIASSFGQREQRNYQREWIKATVGPEYIDAFQGDSTSVDEVSGGASVAGLENAIMQEGKSPIFSLDNEHQGHLAVHLALAKQVIDGITQQQIDVVAADKIFTVLVPHLEEHYKAVVQNILAKQFVASIEKPLAEVVRYAQLNHRNAIKSLQAQQKQQMEEQAKTQATLNDEQRKNLVVQGDERRKDIKIEAQVDRAKEASQQRGDALQRKTDADIANKQKKTEADVAATHAKISASSSSESTSGSELANMVTNNPISPFDLGS